MGNVVGIKLSRDCKAILIPDGTPLVLKKDDEIFIETVLGGMFTVETLQGRLLRIDGRDADAIGQPIPEERTKLDDPKYKDMPLDELVWEELKTCYDPEIPVNMVDLGLIYECNLSKGKEGTNVHIVMTLTAPGCGMGEVMKSDVQSKVQELPGVGAVMVDLEFDPPWEQDMMSEAAKLQLGML